MNHFSRDCCDQYTLLVNFGVGHRTSPRYSQLLRYRLEFLERGALLKSGTMVDATIVHAPSSTKNKARRHDPELHQTKKGNQWFFGMKIHVGADVNSGLVHTVSVTPANASDVSQLPCLLREDDQAGLDR